MATWGLWHKFFPEKIDVAPCVAELLRFVYPTVGWSRVTFHEGWPHLLKTKGEGAITLPSNFSFGGMRIYFEPGKWNPCNCNGLEPSNPLRWLLAVSSLPRDRDAQR